MHTRDLKQRKSRPPVARARPRIERRARSLDSITFERHCFEDTGLYHSYVLKLFDKCRKQIVKPRNRSERESKCSLSPFLRMYVCLMFIRKGHAGRSEMRHRFNVSNSYVTRDIRHLVPILYTNVCFPSHPSFVTHFMFRLL